MAQKKSTYNLEVGFDGSKATKGLKGLADDSKSTADKVDLVADALRAMADKGESDLNDVRAEAKNTAEIFDKLSDAVGDTGDAVTKADIQKIAQQLSKAGIEASDLDSRIDDVADSLRRMGATKQEAEQLTTELEQTQRAARDLDGTDIDIDVKSDRVRQAGDDLDRATDAADRAQTGIGTLRGVTDELGGSAGQIGTYGAAMVDAGETVQIFSKQLGLSEESAAKLSATLGGVAIAATAALAIGTVLWSKWNEDSERAKAKTQALTDALGEQLGILDKIKEAANVGADSYEDLGEAITAAIIDGADEKDVDKITRALSALGLNVKQLGPTFIAMREDSTETLRRLADDAGVGADALDLVTSAAQGNATALRLVPDQYQAVTEALATLYGQARDFDISKSAGQQLADLKVSADAATLSVLAQAEAQAKAKDADADAADVLNEYLKIQADNARQTAENVRIYGEYEAGVRAAMQAQDGAEASARKLALAEREAANAAAAHRYEHDQLKNSLSDRSAFLAVQDGFDNVEQAAAEAYEAAANGAADAEQKARRYEQALIDQKQKVIDYATEVLGLPSQVVSDIVAQMDPASGVTLDTIERRLEELSKGVNVPVRIQEKRAGGGGYYAAGGTVYGPPGGYTTITTSEFGAERITVPNGSHVATAAETARSRVEVAGAPPVVNNFYGSLVADRAVRRAERSAVRKGLR